ncbi:hypothetical protein JOC77_002273 [Peribacillus deserti]|uniref:M50 family peptidase n=1 Tax=Peribacillus deserti TaxID=673318 RepID=A0ABS2QI71_9BACI|nr:M50 family metallopeptidase [Peribacillus deserti]MBM7692842.1 hypothetical protein [Peribacillus deserti]
MVFLSYILGALFLCRIPVIGRYLSVVHTLIHEVGHALCSLLFDGKVRSISLYSNTEGLIMTGSRSWIGKVMTSFAGYPFSSAFALLCFTLISDGHAAWVIYGIGSTALVALLLWVRNVYGIFWCLSFIAILMLIITKGSETWINHGGMLLSGILLTQSIQSAFMILYISFKTPREAGDAANLARYTMIPAQIWGILFFAFALFSFTKVCVSIL